jgi:hypothetical protein
MFTTSWGYNKSAVNVDTTTSTPTLSVAGTVIVKAVVADLKLQLQWCDGEWETWEELQSAEELQNIKTTAQEKLDQAKDRTSKGKGKKGPE